MTNPYVGVRSSSAMGISSVWAVAELRWWNEQFILCTLFSETLLDSHSKMKTFSIRLLFSSLFSFRTLSGLSKLGLSQIVLYKIDKNKNFKDSPRFITFAFVANFSIIILLWISLPYKFRTMYIKLYIHISLCVCVWVWCFRVVQQ